MLKKYDNSTLFLPQSLDPLSFYTLLIPNWGVRIENKGSVKLSILEKLIFLMFIDSTNPILEFCGMPLLKTTEEMKLLDHGELVVKYLKKNRILLIPGTLLF